MKTFSFFKENIFLILRSKTFFLRLQEEIEQKHFAIMLRKENKRIRGHLNKEKFPLMVNIPFWQLVFF